MNGVISVFSWFYLLFSALDVFFVSLLLTLLFPSFLMLSISALNCFLRGYHEVYVKESFDHTIVLLVHAPYRFPL